MNLCSILSRHRGTIAPRHISIFIYVPLYLRRHLLKGDVLGCSLNALVIVIPLLPLHIGCKKKGGGGGATYTPLEYMAWWKIGSNLMFQSGNYSRKIQGIINRIIEYVEYVPKIFFAHYFIARYANIPLLHVVCISTKDPPLHWCGHNHGTQHWKWYQVVMWY